MQLFAAQPTMMPGGTTQRAGRTVKVGAERDRFGAALQLSNWRFDCKISGQDTGGALCVYDTIRTAKGGPPLHVHHAQDEWFFVRTGQFIFKIGDETFELGAGDSLLGPRGVPHTFSNLTDSAVLMVAFQPAGTIERLFQEIARLSGSRTPTLDDWRKVVRAHNVDIVGPPLHVG